MIKQQLAEGAAKRRVGLIVSTGAPARQHSKILDASGAEVGEVTSGGFSPCLQKNIAMGARRARRLQRIALLAACALTRPLRPRRPGYVTTALSKAGTAVKVDVRGRVNDAVVTKMPFVPTHYFKG